MTIIKLLKKAVIVITAVILLLSSTISSYAISNDVVTEDIPYIDDISYEYIGPSFTPQLMYFNAAAGFADFGADAGAWSSVFDELGIYIKEAGPYALGYLIAGGMFLYGVEGLVTTIIEDGPYAYECLVGLTYQALDAVGQLELESIFQSIMNGTSFVVSADLAAQITSFLSSNIISTPGGYVADTSWLFPSTYSSGVVDGDAPEKMFLNSSNAMFDFTNIAYNEWNIQSNNFWSMAYFTTGAGSMDSSQAIFQNNLTGASISFFPVTQNSANGYRFYYPTLCQGQSADYWSLFMGSASQRLGFSLTPFSATAERPFTIAGTGTEIDGTWASCEYLPGQSLWEYKDLLGNSTVYPIDPLANVLNNTGEGTTGGTAIGNLVDGTTVFPVDVPISITFPINVQPKAETDDGIKDIVIPIIDDISIDVPVDDTVTPDGSEPDNSDPDSPKPPSEIIPSLDNEDGISDFLDNLMQFINGLFDWMPKDVANIFYWIFYTIIGLVTLMIGVFIFDLIWPG